MFGDARKHAQNRDPPHSVRKLEFGGSISAHEARTKGSDVAFESDPRAAIGVADLLGSKKIDVLRRG
jgi:hypothetical protein